MLILSPSFSVWTTRILLELDSSDEAIWTYFDSQHQYILSHTRKSHDQFVARANGQ